jgi:hypothetical protein
MVVQDTTIYIALVTLLNYILVYPKNRVVANIIFIATGGGILIYTTGINAWIGLMTLIIGIVSFIYDGFRAIKK